MEGIFLNEWTLGILGTVGTAGMGIIGTLFTLWVKEKEKRIEELKENVVLLSDANRAHDKILGLISHFEGMITKDEKLELKMIGMKLVDRLDSIEKTIERSGSK